MSDLDLKQLRAQWSQTKAEYAGVDGPIILALIDRCEKAEAELAAKTPSINTSLESLAEATERIADALEDDHHTIFSMLERIASVIQEAD